MLSLPPYEEKGRKRGQAPFSSFFFSQWYIKNLTFI